MKKTEKYEKPSDAIDDIVEWIEMFNLLQKRMPDGVELVIIPKSHIEGFKGPRAKGDHFGVSFVTEEKLLDKFLVK